MDICVYKYCGHMFWFLWGGCQGMDQMIILYLTFEGTKTPFQSGWTILHSCQQHRRISVSPHPHWYFYFWLWLFQAACRILVPWLGIKPALLAFEAQSLYCWTAREVLFAFWIPAVLVGVQWYLWFWLHFQGGSWCQAPFHVLVGHW